MCFIRNYSNLNKLLTVEEHDINGKIKVVAFGEFLQVIHQKRELNKGFAHPNERTQFYLGGIIF